jgi:GH25 family lysozyme M1 (1,4-beta-N-acetylmuramidase)
MIAGGSRPTATRWESRRPPWPAPRMWQYSQTGNVPGVSPPCDLNWWLGDNASLAAYVTPPSVAA